MFQRTSNKYRFEIPKNARGSLQNNKIHHQKIILTFVFRDNSILRKTQPDPSKLAFKDRHKLFEGQANNQMKSKPKMSKKLLELEQQFGGN